MVIYDSQTAYVTLHTYLLFQSGSEIKALRG